MDNFLAKFGPWAGQVPVIGAGAWLWMQVSPAVGMLVGFLGEVLVMALSFGKKLWEDELEAKAVKATANWLENWVKSLRPGFRKRYLRKMADDFSIVNVKTLGMVDKVFKMERVYVDLSVSEVNLYKSTTDPLFGNKRPDKVDIEKAKEELKKDSTIWGVLNSPLTEGAALVIIGPPGSGKSTMLQHVAVTLAQNQQNKYKSRCFLPALILIRQHTARICTGRGPTLGKLLEEHFANTELFPNLKTPTGWFDHQLLNGHCLVMLDGLDEAGSREEIEKVAGWIDRQVRSYPASKFMITSRPLGYKNARLERANVLEVQPFNQAKIEKFIRGWYAENELMGAYVYHLSKARQKTAKDNALKRAKIEANKLLDRLGKSPAIAALAVNPLLVTMIAIVHRYQGTLPEKRVELYNEICEVFLGRWRIAKGMTEEKLTPAQKRAILQPLAVYMMENNLLEIGTVEAMAVIKETMVQTKLTIDPRFLKYLEAGSGLLLEKDPEVWGFAHKTFQEFLTAETWKTQNVLPDWVILIDQTWWHESIRLYAGMADATEIIQSCLKKNTAEALSLAVECEAEALEVKPELREDVRKTLEEAATSDDISKIVVAGKAYLRRRLTEGNWQRLSPKVELDPDFVTYLEYQVFVEESRAKEDYRQPDHWKKYYFRPGNAFEPVTGVRSSDADDFCQWLNQQEGGLIRYRLPIMTEATNLRKGPVAGWYQYSATGTFKHGLLANEMEIREELERLATLPQPDLDFNFEFDLARDNKISIDFDFEMKFDYVLNLAHKRAFVRNLDNDRDYACVFVRYLKLYFDRVQHFRLDQNTDLGNKLDLGETIKLLEVGDFKGALRERERQTLPIQYAIDKQKFETLDLLLKALSTDTFIDYRRGFRDLAAHVCVASYRQFEQYRLDRKVPEHLEGRPWWEKIAAKPTEGREIEKYWEGRKKEALELFWLMKILIAREEGILPAWEGIQLVRERDRG